MRRRGIITASALMLLTLIGITVTSMGMYFALQNQRTRHLQVQAQQRQLLLAACELAPRSFKLGQMDWTSATPAGAVDVRAVGFPGGAEINTRVTLYVTARVQGQAAQEALVLERRGGAWQLVAATLK